MESGGGEPQWRPRPGRLNLGTDIKFFDQLNDASYEINGSDLALKGPLVRLDAYRSHIF